MKIITSKKIHEIEIKSTDQLVTHFKQLFESNNSFVSDRHNAVKITQNYCWNSFFKLSIIDNELPTFINQIKDIMTKYNFESDDNAIVEMHYGFTNDTIQCIKEITIADNTDTGKLNICVVYLDVTCEGGELVFYNKNDTFEPFRTIQTNSCKIVMFEGSVYHKRNDYSKGRRLSVLFKFPRK